MMRSRCCTLYATVAMALLLLGQPSPVRSCPYSCICEGTTVDCSSRGLVHIPRSIPRHTTQLLLQENNITQLVPRDFVSLNKLKQLNLEFNQIALISHRAFEDLVNLRNLNLGNNRISCIRDKTFRNLRKLETLTLSDNNLTTLAQQVFKNKMPHLRRLRLHSNRWRCDCHLLWLKNYLSESSAQGLATLTACHEPYQLRGQYIKSLDRDYYACDERTGGSATREKCEFHSCPKHCSCDNLGFVDCSERKLRELPQVLPQATKHLRFSYNSIQVLAPYVFADFDQLQILSLNYNGIEQVDEDAFQGLQHLKSLHLQHNEIQTLSPNTFKNLKKLEVLFLQANQIRCLKRSTFEGLKNLTTLSLYSNKIQTLPETIFSPLRKLTNLYLANNPLQCDCRLRWLTKYLKRNEALEKSTVKCYGPKPVAGREVARVRRRRYRNCPSGHLDGDGDSCLVQAECPDGCECVGTKVACNGLTKIPHDIPVSVSDIDLKLNNIQVISNNGIFEKYASLKKIDLSNNQITTIEDGAFRGATSLTELILNENQLTDIRASMFQGLDNLQILQVRNNRLNCIGNHSFIGLRHLHYLDLFSNQISTIDQGSFQSLTNIRYLNILQNELNCDCRLIWLRNWFQQNSRISSGKPRCYLPFIQRNIPLTDINPTDFPCHPMTSPLMTCTPKRKCPSMCVCEGSVVRCSNVNLQQIPVHEIPDDVTELYLDRNEIRGIPLEINRFVRLQRLDLSENRISRILANQFRNLTSLQSLLIGYNQIQCVQLHGFIGLRSLQTLSLHSNHLSSIPEGAFDDLSNIRRLGLGENPWHCDCNLRWLVSWMQEAAVDPGIARCSGPTDMSTYLIMTKEPLSFQCNGPLDIKVAAKCNPCLATPCRYGATCLTHPTEIYQCLCKQGFKGRNCETPIDPCILNPCENEGRCHARNERVFECSCKLGFSGDLCETNIDDCVMTSQCDGVNKRCVDGINNFTCECIEGWSGPECSMKTDDICGRERPCRNGGICTNLDTPLPSYICKCPVRYTGANCSELFEPCTNNKCQNGAICSEDFSTDLGYRCLCQTQDFSGQFCNIFQDTRINILQDDPCNHNDCGNNSTCQSTSANVSGYKCLCSPGYTGTHCSSLTSVTFVRNGTFLDLNPYYGDDDDMQLTSLILYVSIRQENGILFYWGNDPTTSGRYNFVAVEFFSGHVKIKRGLEGEDAATLYSPNPINDGTTHKVEFQLRDGQMSVRVDDGRTISRDVSFADHVDMTSPVTQVGGVDVNILEEGKRNWFFSNSTTFKGCLHAAILNGDMVDYRSLTEARGNTEGVRPGSWIDDDSVVTSCSLSCLHGSCIVNRDQEETCVCQAQNTGALCEVPDRSGALACDETIDFCEHGQCFLSPSTLATFCQCDQGFSGKRCEHAGSCGGLDCMRGTCIKLPSGYKCKCPKSYTGDRCQTKVKKCKGTKDRDYYSVTKLTDQNNYNTTTPITCTSLRKYVNIRCNSRSCSQSTTSATSRRLSSAGSALGVFSPQPLVSDAGCCRPVRVQFRRIKMKCTDGRRIIEKVEKVRRCGCLQTCNDDV